MAIQYRLMAPQGLLVTVWDGVVSFDEWRAHVVHQLADEEWWTASCALTDSRTAASLTHFTDAQRSEIASLYEAAGRRPGNFKVAVIAPKSDTARFATQLLGEPGMAQISSIVFNDLTTACLWLGVERSAVLAVCDELREELRQGR